MTVRQVLSAFRIRFDPEENKNLTEERGFFMKNLIVGQSGGPTAVINSSLYGVIQEGLAHSEEIGHVYGMINGIQGFLKGKYMDLAELDSQTLTALRTTPGAYLGSCRYKLPENLSDPVYAELFWKFEELSIGYFLYIGGNDSMDTVSKLSRAAEIHKSSIRFIGVPKTIDNDLILTDHTPGFGSAAKYVAASVCEIGLDASGYEAKSVTIIEIMGRHAGWLAGAAALATAYGAGPDLVYLPEVDFDMDQFLADVERIYKEKGNCMVAVSEGIHYADGSFVSEAKTSATDGFGHAQLGGLASLLAQVVKEKTGAKVRGIELSLLQRCGAHLASETDIEEAVMSGKAAVENAVNGITDKMVGFERSYEDGQYVCKTKLLPLTDVANTEKKVPIEWINAAHNGVEKPFIDYVLPLIQGEPKLPKEDSLPRFAKLKKVLIK